MAETVQDQLARWPKYGEGICLGRMARAIGDGPPTIKVTGSNGKGSVTAMTAAILQRAGLRVGRFTSPHLRHFGERFAIDGVPATEAELQGAWDRLRPEAGAGAFELMTMLAWELFQGCDVVVAEAGIGGRFDPTRVLPGPLAALVSVDLEHTALLGGTLELIACDKADLCPPGGTCFVGEAPPIVEAYNELRGVTTVRTAPWTGELALRGPHQRGNAGVAVALAREFGAGEDAVVAGLREVRWPGRFEEIAPGFWIDVGHTPAAMDVLAETVRAEIAAPVLILGVSEDKPVEAIARRIAPVASRILCTRAWHKGADPRRIQAVVGGEVCATVEEAVAIARADGRPVLVAGGLFLAVEAGEVAAGRDPRALRFF